MTLNQPMFFRGRGRGFTLAELLVAMGITAIILTLLVTVTGVALDGWRISRNKVRAARQAKSALDQFSRDFESMVVRSGNNFEWLRVESKDTGLGPSNNPSPNAARLIFFTAATDRYNGDIGGSQDLGGDVSAVGYELFFKNPITGSKTQDEENQPVFALYRQIINPDKTFEKLLAKEQLKTAFNEFQAGQDRTNNFLCENIYEMSVVFLVEYSVSAAGGRLETKQQRVPVISTGSGAVVKEFSLKGSGIEVDGSPAPNYGRGRIVAVDISVSVITDAAMSRLRSSGISGTAKEKLIAGNTFNYVKTILLPQP